MWALIIGFLESCFSITGIGWVDFLIYFVIESVLAYPVAFKLTGFIADLFGWYDSKGMSILHWTIRILIIFAPFIIVGIVNAVKG